MKKIQYNGSSKILIGIVTKVNAIIDKLIVDVKVNGTSVVVVNQDGEREADIDLSLADQNVKQSPTTSSDNSDYRVLLSKSANDTEETDISRKDTNLKYNPSTGSLQTTKLNGNTVPSGSGNDTLAKTSDIPDLTNYVQKSLTVGLIKNDGTIDQTQYATMSDIPDELADLADDQTHRLVTDTDKTTWNDERLPYGILNTEDLNDLKTSAIYVGRSGNTCLNKPTDVAQFSLLVLRTAYTSTQYCVQILITPRGVEYRRNDYNDTWSAWVMSELTDTTYTASGVVSIDANNNITSTAEANDHKVTQSALQTSNADYPLLLAYSANGTQENQAVWKDVNVTWNPSMSYFDVEGSIRANAFHFVLHDVNVGSIMPNSSYTPVSVSMPSSDGTLALQSELPTNPVLWSENNLLGAKNLIAYPYSGGSNYVRNNVTISVNQNGVITASGSNPSSGFGYGLNTKSKPIVLDPTKSYIMSGLTNGSRSTIRFLLDLWTASQNPVTDAYTTRLYQTTTETTIPSGYKYLQITLYFYTSAGSILPLTVSPMLRLASIADNTFKPDADTNRNLSMYKADLRLIADTEKTSTASRAYAVNELMFFDGNLYRVKTAIANGGAITVNTNVVATTLSAEIKAIRDALNI